MKRKIVFVGLSGGVDSGVSAALLKKEGYDVVGVFIKTWHPDFLKCNEEAERRDAMRIAASLDISFLTFDFSKEYKKAVGDYMIREYKLGRTPNPDVMCNREVKFGAFLKKALSMGADYVATGHYASTQQLKKNFAALPPGGMKNELLHFSSDSRSEITDVSLRTGDRGRHGFFSLLKGRDPTKDQSYFLWTLRQEQLNKILFPVGHLKKVEVRKLAKKFKLPVADKKDSQGICFLGPVDLKEFLSHYIKPRNGKVLNTKGEVIGHHDGVNFLTLGERHGFVVTKKGPNDGPYYIVDKDKKKNILTVSQDKNVLSKSSPKVLKNYFISNTNWISEIPQKDKVYQAQVRYHGELLSCMVKITGKNKAAVSFTKDVLVASGQSIVVYDGEVCQGGGVVI